MEVRGKTVWISAWSYHGDVCFIPFLAHWLIPPAFLPPPLLPSSPNTRSPLEHRQAPRPALSLARQYVSEFGYPKWCHRGSPGLATLCLSEPGGASHHVPLRRVCKTVMLDLLLKLLFLSHSPPHSSKWQQCQKLVSSFHLQIQQITKHSEGCYRAHLTFSSLTNLPQAKMQSPKMERIGRKVKSRKQCQDYIQGWQLLRLWPWSSAGYHTQTWKKENLHPKCPRNHTADSSAQLVYAAQDSLSLLQLFAVQNHILFACYTTFPTKFSLSLGYILHATIIQAKHFFSSITNNI